MALPAIQTFIHDDQQKDQTASPKYENLRNSRLFKINLKNSQNRSRQI